MYIPKKHNTEASNQREKKANAFNVAISQPSDDPLPFQMHVFKDGNGLHCNTGHHF
jgi:hypothetical protein